MTCFKPTNPNTSLIYCHFSYTYTYYLNFESEVFLQVLDDHDKKGQFDAKGFLWIRWAGDVCGAV